jgi:hypothetical protein
MALYQLYFLNDSDRDVGRQELRCASDKEALRVTRSLCFDRNIDVWNDGRRVARVSRDQFALQSLHVNRALPSAAA